MVKFTFLGRVSDALPLTMSLDKTEDAYMSEYHRQAKLILRRMMPSLTQPPLGTRGAIKSDPYVFYYLVDMGVCFLTLCEASYPRLLAFSMLFEIQKEFFENFSADDVNRAQRPYSLIQFEPFLDKTKRRYLHTRSLRTPHNLADLSERLQSVPLTPINQVLPEWTHVGKQTSLTEHVAMSKVGAAVGAAGSAVMATVASSERRWSVVATASATMATALVWLYQELMLEQSARYMYFATLIFSLFLLIHAVLTLRHYPASLSFSPAIALAAVAFAVAQILLSAPAAAPSDSVVEGQEAPIVRMPSSLMQVLGVIMASAMLAAALWLRRDLKAQKRAILGDHVD